LIRVNNRAPLLENAFGAGSGALSKHRTNDHFINGEHFANDNRAIRAPFGAIG
jgi:hypothetical protein